MRSLVSFSFFAVALLFCVVFATMEEHKEVLFGYGNTTNGPNQWGSLNPHYSRCSSGKTQSPVNIVKKQTLYNRKLGSIVRDYRPANATLLNHIVNVAMFYKGGGGDMVLQGKNYTLKQMHWHTPSEHQINGVSYDAEFQLVHQALDGQLAVVTTLYQTGDEDPFISRIQESLKQLGGEKCGEDNRAEVAVGEIDTKHMERKTRKYFRYVGSLTTPPCTENVIWVVLGKVRSVSKEQIEMLKSPLDEAYKTNARPVQALQDRRVEMFHELAEDKKD